MTTQKYPVGIDLGTTFSSLAYIDEQGQPQIIRVTDDDATIGSTSYSVASAIYFKTPQEPVVGNRALDYSVLEPDRLAIRFKRQMGAPVYLRDSRDAHGQRVPFEVEGQSFRPEELSALVLKRLKAIAEAQIGPIQNVVVSVPFVFDEARRRATQHAGQMAGFASVELIDEPVAASIAYGHALFQGAEFRDREMAHLLGDQRILVYDLGGGTFDATIVQLHTSGLFEVLATNGDERLGGSDWDDILLDIICQEFHAKTGANPRQNFPLLQDLLLKTIEAKKTLSVKPRVEIEIEHEGTPVKLVVSVGQFKAATRHLVSRTTDTMAEMLRAKQWNWNYCDKLVVVGGASRMPMIAEQIKLISERDVDMSLSPDTAIAFGAALFAALKSGRKSHLIDDVQTVNSHGLGLLVKNQKSMHSVNDIVIPQNTKTLTKTTKTYRVQNPRKGVNLIVLQGNSPDPEVCLRIGTLQIRPPANAAFPADQPSTVAVTYSFQENGLLHVGAAMSLGRDQKPVKASAELLVENSMSAADVTASTQRIRGIEVE
jgi:molecular chaperone DnaK